MIIKGQDIVLRAIEPEDAEMLLNLINDPETEYMLGGWSFPVSVSNQLKWINTLNDDRGVLRCIIEAKQSSKAIGTAILKDIDYKNGNASIHIKICGSDYRGKGYGSQAIKAIINYGFNELRLHCIYAQINEDNVVSLKVFKKCGFTLEGKLKDRLHKNGNYLSVNVCSILNPNI